MAPVDRQVFWCVRRQRVGTSNIEWLHANEMWFDSWMGRTQFSGRREAMMARWKVDRSDCDTRVVMVYRKRLAVPRAGR